MTAVTGLVLAAGGSSRLGAPKQLLPYGSGTLLGHVLDVARTCALDQLLSVVGGGASAVRAAVDFSGVEVVENVQFGSGCSSSIAAALAAVDVRCDVLVLMLGDQPGVTASTVRTLLDGRGDAALAACAYADGRGHPLAFARSVFPELAAS
ncbi:MAG TPA: NTP transferase domain-containing protein [Solirubrobacteraceae bacterium]|nr:NTP transferase domain-containing protein [Solirubrobacteraceae bacterium]